ncbi:hypothetical protein TRVL_01260 [Trypanosoma vivax]|nr:hypothetical protein TRVL_01260 [Trypanosoma vivax]
MLLRDASRVSQQPPASNTFFQEKKKQQARKGKCMNGQAQGCRQKRVTWGARAARLWYKRSGGQSEPTCATRHTYPHELQHDNAPTAKCTGAAQRWNFNSLTATFLPAQYRLPSVPFSNFVFRTMCTVAESIDSTSVFPRSRTRTAGRGFFFCLFVFERME